MEVDFVAAQVSWYVGGVKVEQFGLSVLVD